MSTWEIEAFANSAGTGTSDRRTIEAWGFAALDLEMRNWARGDLLLTLASNTAFTDAPIFAREIKIVIWRDGVRVWHGWHVGTPRNIAVESESRTYRFADAWYWLEQHPVASDVVLLNPIHTDVDVLRSDGVTVTISRVTGFTWQTPDGVTVTGNWDEQGLATVAGQVRRAVLSAAYAGAPIGLGTTVVSMPSPEQDFKNAKCAEWAQVASRLAPYSVGWWDYSLSVPVFHCRDRAHLTPINHALLSQLEAAGIEPIYEQQAFAVRIRYRWGTGQLDYYDDWAGDNARPDGPGTLRVDVSSTSQDLAEDAKDQGVAAKLFAALGPLAWAGSLNLHERDAALPWYTPGSTLNLTGGRSEWESMGAVVQGVSHHVVAATTDACSITLGAPTHLGVQDWLEVSTIGTLAAETVATTPTISDTNPPGTDPGTPGDPATYEQQKPLPDGPPSVALEYQAQGGLCTMIGLAEMGTPSHPSRYFKTRTFSGVLDGVIRATDPAQPTIYNNSCAVSGSETWTAAETCSGLFQGVNRSYGIAPGSGEPFDSTTTKTRTTPGGVRVAVYSMLEYETLDAWGFTTPETILSPSQRSYQAYMVDYGSGIYTRTAGPGIAYETYTNEDTEDAAYTRDHGSDGWPVYPVGHAHAGEEMWGSAVNAIYTARDSGRTFTKQKIRYRGTVGNLGAWNWWKIVVQLEKQALADTTAEPYGDWTPAGTREHVALADIDGNATIPVTEVDAPRGYQLRAVNWSRELL